MNVQEFIEILTAALSYKFPNDAMMPGITISFLRDNQFYVSLVRYCPKKKVILKSTRMSLVDALSEVGQQLMKYEEKKAEKDPMDYLEEALYYFNQKPEKDNYEKGCAQPPEDRRYPDPYEQNEDEWTDGTHLSDDDIPF